MAIAAAMKRGFDLAGLSAGMLRAGRARGGARAAARAHLAERLGELKGLPQKVGQILALGELAKEEKPFTSLTEGPARLSAARVEALLDERLGREWRARVEWLDPAGIGASLSQVHAARLKDGRRAAIKVLYPGIGEALSVDLKALGWIAAPVGNLRKGYDLGAYQRVLRRSLEGELDLTLEARWIGLFGNAFRGQEDFLLPEVLPGLSGEGVLAMTWVEGQPFAAARRWPAERRRQAGALLARLFCQMVFRHRLLHADPHPGNYRFSVDGGRVRLGLVDFGCSQGLTTAFVRGLRGLIEDAAADRLEPQGALDRYGDLGFNLVFLEPIADRLPAMTRALMAPFTDDGEFDADAWDISGLFQETLGADRYNFRFAGPAGMIHFVRVFKGLIQYLRALGVPVPLRQAFLEATQDGGLGASPKARLEDAPAGAGSSRLRVSVAEGGRTKVLLGFPVGVVSDLKAIMPDDLVERIERRKVDIDAICAGALERGLPPGELFKLHDAGKTVSVWLE